MTAHELQWILDTVKNLPANSRIVELGAFCGRTTAAICQGASGGDKHVTTVDPFDDKAMQLIKEWNTNIPCMFEKFTETLQVFEFSPTVLRMPSLEAVLQIPDKSVDMIFIDAIHTAVGEDIDAWLCKMKPGGIVSGHDYGTSVWQVAEQVLARCPNVSRAPGTIWFFTV